MKKLLLLAMLIILPMLAYAQVALGEEPGTKIDWTPILLVFANGLIAIFGLVIKAAITKYLNNKKDRDIANNALNNALGAVQQAIEKQIKSHPLLSELPVGTPPEIAAGVQSAINNAGPELARLGVTENAISTKLIDRWNLKTVDNPNVPNKTLDAPVAKPIT